MFGLMRAKLCAQPTALREARRLSYCGTCKTLGARYGHRSRFLLNHDIVFLAELLEALAPLAPYAEAPVDRAFRSYNCLALPTDAEAAPKQLGFAAAATLFLAEAMLADHRQDAPSRLRDAGARVLASPFQKAAEDMKDWGLPVEEIRALLASQTGLERRVAALAGQLPVEEALSQVAQPTATATGLLFEAGARLMEKEGAAPAMKALGETFGTLIYLLDAFEDEAKDARRGEFNALRAAFGVTGELSGLQRQLMGYRVAEAGEAVGARIRGLPMAEDRKKLFELRLRGNLRARLGQCCVGAIGCDASARKSSRPPHGAVSRACDVVRATLAGSGSWGQALLAPLVLVLALPPALLFPAWVGGAMRLGEAYGLLFNLMAAGQAARLMTRPFRFASQGPEDLEDLAEVAKEGAPLAKKSGGGCGGCDCCDCCDDCDCGDCCGSCDC